MCQHSHRRDVVHAVRRYVALLVMIKPVEGESTSRCVVHSPLALIAGLCQYGSPILQPVAQRCSRQLALVPVGHRGGGRRKGAGGATSGQPPAAPVSLY